MSKLTTQGIKWHQEWVLDTCLCCLKLQVVVLLAPVSLLSHLLSVCSVFVFFMFTKTKWCYLCINLLNDNLAFLQKTICHKLKLSLLNYRVDLWEMVQQILTSLFNTGQLYCTLPHSWRPYVPYLSHVNTFIQPESCLLYFPTEHERYCEVVRICIFEFKKL